MAFKITQKPTYTVPVVVFTPNDKGTVEKAGFDKSEFKATFKRIYFDEMKELRDKPQREVLEKVLVGFADLLDENDSPVEFNETNLSELLNIPQALTALAEAFWKSIYKAEAKN